MPVEGAIAERTRGTIPITWDALSRDSRFGDGLLQTTIDTVKEIVFGTVVAPLAEATYPLVLIDYTAKLAALELINPGIDFWMNQPISESATGVNENHTFTERARELRELRKILLEDTRRDRADMEALVAELVGYRRRNPGIPLLSSMDDELLTPSPQEFPRPYVATERS
jgi:hypothetical protein